MLMVLSVLSCVCGRPMDLLKLENEDKHPEPSVPFGFFVLLVLLAALLLYSLSLSLSFSNCVEHSFLVFSHVCLLLFCPIFCFFLLH